MSAERGKRSSMADAPGIGIVHDMFSIRGAGID
jgi:hypothetical protein